MNQSKFAIKNESHRSIKNENGIYLDISPLSSVKEEVQQCLDNGDGDQPFLIDNNINNTIQRKEQCVGENCRVKSEVCVLNNLETDNYSFKPEPEDLDNSFQPYGTVVKKETDNFKLEIQYNDKVVKIEKGILEATVFESEIVIEKNDILSILNEEKCNTVYHSNLADLPRTIYKELVNCNNKSNKKNTYICDLCHQSFISKKLLTFHMKYHFPNDDYCLNNNLKKRNSKHTKCKQLKKYIKIKNIFVCTICSKEFNDQSNCRRHTLTHVNTSTNTKKFKCHFCKKQFTTKYNLRVHSRLHTGDLPYICDFCHLKFDRNDKMLTHRRIHEENFRTYDCKDCHRQYLYKNSLLRHVKIHYMENIYCCNHCQQPFTRKDSLIVHLRSKHTGKKPFKCRICKKRFFENSVLVRHMMTHNKSE